LQLSGKFLLFYERCAPYSKGTHARAGIMCPTKKAFVRYQLSTSSGRDLLQLAVGSNSNQWSFSNTDCLWSRILKNFWSHCLLSSPL